MFELKPLKNQTPLEFVERADAHEIDEIEIDSVLKEHFNVSEDKDLKRLKLQSNVFWRKLFVEHINGIYQRGGSRYAALKFIQQKNGEAGQKTLSQSEIDGLIDSVGKWSR